MRQVTKPRRLALKPAWRKSFTTTRVVGASPSDPPQYRNPSEEAANALVAAQHKSPTHLNLHACSALLRKIMGSHLARAFARRVRNCLVSSDHRPPTSPARTTNRALPLSFLRLAAKTAPATWAARGCAEPSQCKTDTTVVSTASWGNPTKGSPSAKISEHGIRDRSAACLPADASPGALHCEPPQPQESSPRARSSVVAKIVERTATRH